MLTKKVYGIEKRAKVCRINQWDCRPTSSKKLHPDRKEKLRSRLLRLEQVKSEAAASGVDSAISVSEKRNAICFLQLFDNKPTLTSSVNRHQQNREGPEQQLKVHNSSLNYHALLQQKTMTILTAVKFQPQLIKLIMYHHQNI